MTIVIISIIAIIAIPLAIHVSCAARRHDLVDVVVSAEALKKWVEVLQKKGSMSDEQKDAARGVNAMLWAARRAAAGRSADLLPWPLEWWRGQRIETAYQNLHAAKVQSVYLFDDAEIDAAKSYALRRLRRIAERDEHFVECVEDLKKTLDRSQKAKRRFVVFPARDEVRLQERREALRKTLHLGYVKLQRHYTQQRSFRNVIFAGAILTAAIVAGVTIIGAVWPDSLPLCFDVPAPKVGERSCPSGQSIGRRSTGGDVGIVAILGSLGGVVSAALSIQRLGGSSSPYDVTVVLALLKLPLGALTAIAGLLAIGGEFVPGLSALDTQEQVLAYALLLGFSQQLITRLLDKRAEKITTQINDDDRDDIFMYRQRSGRTSLPST